MTIVSEINAIVTENGGTASTDGTIIGALDALADTLAGENVERQNSITKAIEALAPYIPPQPVQFDVETVYCSALFYVFSNDFDPSDPGTPITAAVPGTAVYCAVSPDDGYTFSDLAAGLSPIEFDGNNARFTVGTDNPFNIVVVCSD